MQIAPDKVVHIHYTLRNDEGSILDSSSGGNPLAYLHGKGNLIPGLEQALEGRQSGERLNVTVEPKDAYGERNEGLVQQVPRRMFSGVTDIKPGMRFHAQSEQGERMVTVTQVSGELVTVDGNHPLAGQSLSFEVEITEVRDATTEELTHGHVHGPGGHHHG